MSPLRSKVRFTSIDITWNRPQQPNGIILRYEIIYRVNDSTSPITENTTNPNDTITFRIPALTLGTRVSVSVSAYTSVGQGPANLTNLVTLSETREFMLKSLVLVQNFHSLAMSMELTH